MTAPRRSKRGPRESSQGLLAGAILLVGALLAVTGCAGTGGPTRLDAAPRVESDAPLDPAVAVLLARRADGVDAAPDVAEAWADLARGYHANELFDLGETCYRQALLRDPEQAVWWYHLARVEERRGDLAAAIVAIDRSIDLDPAYVHAWWRRGDWLRELQRTDEAGDSYRRALEIDAACFPARTGRARLLIDRGANEEAVAQLTVLVAERPDAGFAHFLLGSAYRELGRTAEAERHLGMGTSGRVIRDDVRANELVRDRVGFGSRVQLANQYLLDGQYDTALSLFESLRGERPDDARVLLKLGSLHARLDRPERAQEILEEGVRLHPDDDRLQLELAAAYRASGDGAKALEHVDRAIAINPSRSVGHARRGRLLEESERLEEATVAYADALRLEPGNAPLWQASGDTLARLGRWVEAAEQYRRALELDPSDADLHVRHGAALYRAGRFAEAVAALQEALRLGPARPDAVEGLLADAERRRAVGG